MKFFCPFAVDRYSKSRHCIVILAGPCQIAAPKRAWPLLCATEAFALCHRGLGLVRALDAGMPFARAFHLSEALNGAHFPCAALFTISYVAQILIVSLLWYVHKEAVPRLGSHAQLKIARTLPEKQVCLELAPEQCCQCLTSSPSCRIMSTVVVGPPTCSSGPQLRHQRVSLCAMIASC